MINVAVLGYGTIGKGVVTVLQTNADSIEKKTGERIEVKRILDLRDFPGDPNADKVVHDYDIIREDEDIQVVVECMGGLEPAYTFVKSALLAGRSVATSNKELVARYGPDLLSLAEEKKCSFLFEASVGGGIPVIRPMLVSLTADEIDEISGILNGTTNYMLTRMEKDGAQFDAVLKEAQERGYAELHPEADIEGWDACRKIAILTSVANEQVVDYEDIPTEGITGITAEDIRYAAALGRTIKLIARSKVQDGRVYARVSPMMVSLDHPLAAVKDVYNAIFIHGNMVDDVMFYGKGAGSLPTASAVAADVIDCVRHIGSPMNTIWNPEKLTLGDPGDFERRFFVRLCADTPDDTIRERFGETRPVSVSGLSEKAFVTGLMKERDFDDALKGLALINRIRLH